MNQKDVENMFSPENIARQKALESRDRLLPVAASIYAGYVAKFASKSGLLLDKDGKPIDPKMFMEESLDMAERLHAKALKRYRKNV